MATITKTHTFQEGDRTHTQTVSIDFDDEFMIIQHNGEEIALSILAFQKLINLYIETDLKN